MNVKTKLISFPDIKGITNLFLQNKESTEYSIFKFGVFIVAYLLKKLNTWSDKWILHHDNAPSHTAYSVKQKFGKKKVLEYPLNFLNLALCVSFIFLKLNISLKGSHSESF
jgi:hypothetical protein